jgi:hypothetical protein
MTLKHKVCEVETHYKFFEDFLWLLARDMLDWWLQNQGYCHFYKQLY